MSKPLVPLVVVRGGQPWLLTPRFSRSVAYRRHRTSLERIEGYMEMLEYLEQLVVRLRRAATIDRTIAATQEEWLRRSAEETQAFFEQVCVAHDLRRGVGFALRFLNPRLCTGTACPRNKPGHASITRDRGPVVSPEVAPAWSATAPTRQCHCSRHPVRLPPQGPRDLKGL